MHRLCRGFLSVALTALLASVAGGGQPDDKPEPTGSWEKAAEKQNLTKAELKLLREHKFVITGQSTRQVFDPYEHSNVPVFVTSDSILNAYHVLEESIYRMELAHSRKLPGVLEQFSKHFDATTAKLKGDDDLLKAAKKRAAIFLGVARNLLDEKTLPEDADVKAEVLSEVKRILAANAVSKPAWLAPPDDGVLVLDYSRFKPRGLYTLTPGLERYFRAVAWLQAIPFRLDRDEELAAFALMCPRQFDRNAPPPPDRNFWYDFRAFLGDEDDWDVLQAPHLGADKWTKAGLAEFRKELKEDEKLSKSQINDQLRFAPTERGAKAEVAFRFLSAYRLPAAVMFQRTTDPKWKRDFPSGLEVAAALGSPFAREKFKKDNPKLLAEIDAARPLFQGKNLYAEYLKCLRVLLERTEPEAPEFLRREPWRIKTTQTALAGWAQMRHTWVLHAKIQSSSAAALEPIAGFVEPVPSSTAPWRHSAGPPRDTWNAPMR